ncbi:hypothetical protein [Thermobifida cellulosilytica]|uniref:Pyridine nucleotide-disulfide oxidoreductase n=1 Tax=Thermobifida cellulosilytica TB100 TaxID=665004 RepID=A0A147KGL6_THECS|nr:hypothetical protein [Thermobifida cellulosilytica]KUP96437.1 hypothetical protein AC529_11765 [Thermobifida cellulosilytica TB100]
MGVIRTEHVEELLRSADAGAVLVVRSGAAEVVPSARLGEPGYRGALQVVSRGELEEQAAGRDPAELARGLDAALSALGG